MDSNIIKFVSVADGTDSYSIELAVPIVGINVDTENKPISDTHYECALNVFRGSTALTPGTSPVTGVYTISITDTSVSGLKNIQADNVNGKVVFNSDPLHALASGQLRFSVYTESATKVFAKNINYNALKIKDGEDGVSYEFEYPNGMPVKFGTSVPDYEYTPATVLIKGYIRVGESEREAMTRSYYSVTAIGKTASAGSRSYGMTVSWNTTYGCYGIDFSYNATVTDGGTSIDLKGLNLAYLMITVRDGYGSVIGEQNIDIRYGVSDDAAQFLLRPTGIIASISGTKTVFNSNGLTVYSGALSIYKGSTSSSDRVFYADVNGDLCVKGNITTGSNMCGWSILAHTMTCNSGGVGIGDGNASSPAGNYVFWAGDTTPGNAPYRVNKNGNLVASNLTVYNGGISVYKGATSSTDRVFYADANGNLNLKGNIISGSGMSGWSILEHTLTCNSGKVGIGDGSSSSTAGDYVFWAGNATPGSAPFNVKKDGSIIASKLVVGSSMISDDAVTNTKIASSAVTEGKLASNAVTEGKIYAGAVTTNKLAAGAVTASKIASGTITANEIAANTITASKIASGTITATEIASGTITASKIASGTITSEQIAANTITVNKLVSGIGNNLDISGNSSVTSKYSIISGIAISSSGIDITGDQYIKLSTSGDTDVNISKSGIEMNTAGTIKLRADDTNGSIIFGTSVQNASFSVNNYGDMRCHSLTVDQINITGYSSIQDIVVNDTQPSKSCLWLKPTSSTEGAWTFNIDGNNAKLDTEGYYRDYKIYYTDEQILGGNLKYGVNLALYCYNMTSRGAYVTLTAKLKNGNSWLTIGSTSGQIYTANATFRINVPASTATAMANVMTVGGEYFTLRVETNYPSGSCRMCYETVPFTAIGEGSSGCMPCTVFYIP